MRKSSGTWTSVPAPATQGICALAVLGPDDIWAVGTNMEGDPLAPVGGSHWNGTHSRGGDNSRHLDRSEWRVLEGVWRGVIT